MPMSTYNNEQAIGISSDTPFINRVLFYFGLAILVSALGTYVGFTYLIGYFIMHPASIWVVFALELVLIFTSRLWSQRRPLNYLLFAFFAFLSGLTMVPLLASIIIEAGGFDIIVKALAATTLVFSAAAIYGWVTNRNLSGLRGFLTLALIGMIIVSVIGIFIPWNSAFEMVFCLIGVVVFSGYTMYDIQRIKVMPESSPMDAALMLYLDIFNLFLYILRLMSNSRN